MASAPAPAPLMASAPTLAPVVAAAPSSSSAKVVQIVAIAPDDERRAARPPVTFEPAVVPWGGSAEVEVNSSGGWVFCGLGEGGCGDYLSALGGSVELLKYWSGDETRGTFVVTHDGASASIHISYCTRPD